MLLAGISPPPLVSSLKTWRLGGSVERHHRGRLRWNPLSRQRYAATDSASHPPPFAIPRGCENPILTMSFLRSITQMDDALMCTLPPSPCIRSAPRGFVPPLMFALVHRIVRRSSLPNVTSGHHLRLACARRPLKYTLCPSIPISSPGAAKKSQTTAGPTNTNYL